MSSGFFGEPGEDEALEARNRPFWSSLLSHIRADDPTWAPRHVLDVGSHLGGLLHAIASRWSPESLFGMEPSTVLREQALFRLKNLARDVQILDSDDWSRVPHERFDLVTCHEVLWLIEDLDVLMKGLRSCLARRGRAYLVTGCHTENPVWPRWREMLRQQGHAVFDHAPLDILSAAWRADLLPRVRPLQSEGWVTYDPGDRPFAFESVDELLSHHFRHKLLFRISRQKSDDT